jgi:ribA/ribD-fused uncharacterized protein
MKAADQHEADMILSASSPSEAKRLGRKCKLRPNWELDKVGIMYAAVQAKFVQNPELREKLIATGNTTLIEGNHWGDRYWGESPVGVGKNILGQILMLARSELR